METVRTSVARYKGANERARKKSNMPKIMPLERGESRGGSDVKVPERARKRIKEINVLNVASL